MPDDEIQEVPDAAKRWLETAAILRQLAEATLPTDWLPPVPPTGTPFPDEDQRHAARQAILETYSPSVRQECIYGLSEWFVSRGREMRELSQPARYWLRRMANYTSEFCESQVCQLRQAPGTIVAYPNGTPMQVCYWLIGDWWGNVGLKKFVQQATTDQSLFYSDNTS